MAPMSSLLILLTLAAVLFAGLWWRARQGARQALRTLALVRHSAETDRLARQSAMERLEASVAEHTEGYEQLRRQLTSAEDALRDAQAQMATVAAVYQSMRDAGDAPSDVLMVMADALHHATEDAVGALTVAQAHGGASHQAVDRATLALLQIGRDVQQSADRVRALAPASEQVDQFVDTVARIAKQTHLLALNAGIEAARAGDGGIGFAVVAEEIRSLAVESAASATRVAGTVQRVREEIASAVQAIEGTAKAMDSAGPIARDANRAHAALIDAVARATLLAAQLQATLQQHQTIVRGIHDPLRRVEQRLQQLL